MPSLGDLFADTRGEDRMMRVSYHPEREAVVLSVWGGGVCRASFRMPIGDVPRLLALLGGVVTGGTPPAGTLPDRTDPRTPVVERAAVAEQGGGRSGATQRSALPIVPAPRVA